MAITISPRCPDRVLSRRLAYAGGATGHRFTPRSLAAKEAVERKIREGIYRFAESQCFCGERDGDTLATIDGYGLWYPLVLCRRCGLLRVNPRMTRDSYIAFYDAEYRALYGDYDTGLDELFAIRVKQGEAIHHYVRERLGRKFDVVLDVGCQMGTALLPFRREGAETYGVDFGTDFLEIGRKKTDNPNLLVGDIDAFLALGRRADLVICSHVVEHFLDLEKELLRLREAIAPQGCLYVEVPGTAWFTDELCKGDLLGLLQNAHTYQFNGELLTYVMECCGFELIHRDDRIRSLFRPSERFRDKADVPQGQREAVLSYLTRTERRFLPKWRLKRALDVVGLTGPLKRLLGR